MPYYINLLILVGLSVLGFLTGFLLSKFLSSKYIKENEKKAKEIIMKAEEEAKDILQKNTKQIEEMMRKQKAEIEKEYKAKRQELMMLEKKIQQREENLERKQEILNKKERELAQMERTIAERMEELKKMEEERMRKLEEIANMSFEEARYELLKKAEDSVRVEIQKLTEKLEREALEKAKERARDIIISTIQRIAVDTISLEITTSTVKLDSDELKGRIIGREGRNIRAFETITGVDLIIDDTPEVIVISSFDPLRREIAKITLERLAEDGRINPSRIEEIYERVRQEMDEKIREEGEKVFEMLGLTPHSQEEIYMVGKLRYRISYGQNVLQHSIEVAKIGAIMAAELGLDVEKTKIAGLLHDIGKVVDSSLDGLGHALAGAEIAKRWGYDEVVVNAISAHHEEVDALYPESIIVMTADAISAARPGARKENLELYIQRLKQMEEISMSFKGVEKAYAVQAGRELRVFVKSDEISDEEAKNLIREIAKRIEQEIKFPRQIKITLIREKRFIEYVK